MSREKHDESLSRDMIFHANDITPFVNGLAIVHVLHMFTRYASKL